MVHKTRGIVLRTVKYGETSLVATLFTELFGVQTYMVNGVRASKKLSSKAGYFQHAAILDLVVYHNEHKSMQRIKEFAWSRLYQNLFNDVIKNNIATGCISKRIYGLSRFCCCGTSVDFYGTKIISKTWFIKATDFSRQLLSAYI